MVTTAMISYGGNFVATDPVSAEDLGPLGPRRIVESQRGITWLGATATHLGYSEAALQANLEGATEFTAKFIVDRRVRIVYGFGPDGYDKHVGHVDSHDVTAGAVAMARAMGRDVMHRTINSSHTGAHEIATDDNFRRVQLGAMACNASQWNIRRPGEARYKHGLTIAGHSVRADTWMSWAAGGVLPILDNGVTFDER
jgi:hypothetical protein